MGLTITTDWTIKDVNNYIDEQVKAYIQYVVSVYSNAGRAMVEDARGRSKESGDSFGNITWKLRSSIGCVVAVDGKTVFEYFPVLMTGAEGARKGKVYAESLVAGDKGISLVIVAGEDYARSVENKGKNVITATSLIAEQILEQYINQAA